MADAATDFAIGLLAKGIELLVRNNRLWVWPKSAWRHLTDAELAFLREHRDELKAIALSKALPEATVTWTPHPTAPESVPAPVPEVPCPYCGRRCVGDAHPAFAVLHADDPTEVERRRAEASAVMRHMVRYGRWM